MDHWGWLFLQIFLINLVLSGDNAVVIAMASRRLPVHLRRRAVQWGTAGAVLLRLVLTFVAVMLLKLPLLQAVGALLLAGIAAKLLLDDGGREVASASTLAGAVQIILLADVVMSLDNVLAIAAIAKGDMLLLLIGVALSIPLILWGSSIIMRLLDRFPVLVYIGAAILGFAAGEMLLADSLVGPWLLGMSERLDRLTPLLGAMAVLSFGLFKPLLERARSARGNARK